MLQRDREFRILSYIVEYYIKTGQPVGSSSVATRYFEKGKNLSSATIRNVFKNMEKKGWITKTHLSSGRIPTKKGFRIYIENLLNEFNNLKNRDILDSSSIIIRRMDTTSMLFEMAELLEKKTGVLSLVLFPDLLNSKVKRINFVSLSDRKILVLLVATNNMYRESIVEVDRPVAYHDLVAASNYLNRNFSGLTLFEIKKKLLELLKKGISQINHEANRIIKLVYENIDRIYNSEKEGGIIIKGLSNLLNKEYIKEIDVLRDLVENLEQKRYLYEIISNLLDRELSVSLDFPVENFSFIISPYSVIGGAVGALGLVGPLRMDYRKNIRIVKSITHSIVERMFIQ